jgi:hypothetical protein
MKKNPTMKWMPCIREVGPYNIYLMFLWQVEFWLAKNLLLKLQPCCLQSMDKSIRHSRFYSIYFI